MLTDDWLEENAGTLAPAVREFTDGRGLSVRISAKGKIVFQIRYRFRHKPVRLDLDVYPTMSLRDARIENERLREYLKDGVDPRTVVGRTREAERLKRRLARHGLHHEEMAEILNVVEHSKLAPRSKLFLTQCLSVVASLEGSRSPERAVK